jgi:hypothetical protein
MADGNWTFDELNDILSDETRFRNFIEKEFPLVANSRSCPDCHSVMSLTSGGKRKIDSNSFDLVGFGFFLWSSIAF